MAFLTSPKKVYYISCYVCLLNVSVNVSCTFHTLIIIYPWRGQIPLKGIPLRHRANRTITTIVSFLCLMFIVSHIFVTCQQFSFIKLTHSTWRS